MKCFCPKCSAGLTPDIKELPPEGVFLKCTECNNGFSLQRESFARRALRKGESICCTECGSQLGPSIYCPGCHAVYPDYYATETSSAAKKKLDKLLATLKPSKKKQATLAPIRLEESRGGAMPAATKGGKGIGKPLQLAVTISILIALLGGGGFYYYQEKSENEYAEKYVRTISGIKTAADFAINISTKRVNDWRTNQTPTPPSLSEKELKSLANGKSDLQAMLKRIEDTPKKFIPSSDAIKKYHQSYLKLNELLTTPATSIDSFATSAQKLADDLKKSGRELKAGLPPRIAEKLSKSAEQNKSLKEL